MQVSLTPLSVCSINLLLVCLLLFSYAFRGFSPKARALLCRYSCALRGSHWKYLPQECDSFLLAEWRVRKPAACPGESYWCIAGVLEVGGDRTGLETAPRSVGWTASTHVLSYHLIKTDASLPFLRVVTTCQTKATQNKAYFIKVGMSGSCSHCAHIPEAERRQEVGAELRNLTACFPWPSSPSKPHQCSNTWACGHRFTLRPQRWNPLVFHTQTTAWNTLVFPS